MSAATAAGADTARGKRRPPALIIAPLVLVVVALLVAGITLLPPPAPLPTATPGAPAAIPPPTTPLLVNLSRRGGGPAAVGFPVQLGASAIGLTGIAGLELWVGGTRVEVVATTDPARPAATARWEWTPDQPGEVVLVARAFDAEGRTGQSSPLRLTVAKQPPRSFRLATATVREGETLADVVARMGGDLDLARYLNPDAGSAPLPADLVVPVPLFDDVAPASARHELTDRPFEVDARPAADIGALIPAGLAVPQLNVAVDDCTVTATASNGGSASDGLAFSALPPVGEAFLPLPPIAPDAGGGGSTSFLALGGTNWLTVSTYDAGASVPSALVPVAVPDDCGTAGWEGDARLDNGTLVFPGTADKAYAYLRVGTGAWQRVPGGAGTFVSPIDGVFDFKGLLPELAGLDLELEAWGWVDGALKKLGTGHYTAPGQQLYSGGLIFGGDPIIGFGTSLDIVIQKGGSEVIPDEILAKHSTVDLPGPNSTSGKRTFKWSTTVPGVTHLVWQVLPYPLGPTAVSLAPPFLIDTDTIAVQNLSSGYFTLDLKSYLLDDTGSTGVWSTTKMGEQLINQVVQSNPWIPGATTSPGEVLVDPGSLWWPQPSGGGGNQGPPTINQATLEDLAFLIPPPSTLYVRVIPFVGSIPLPTASNAVSFDVVEPSDPIYLDTSPPKPPPSYPGAYTMEATFFAPTGSNSAYARCVRVVKGGKTVSDPIYTIYGGSNWNNGTTHCLPPPSDDDGWSLSDAFETFAGWVGDVWDFVSEGYAWIQDQVVKAVLAVVPCEQFTSKETCEKIAHTALQAVLTSFGLPPEIPNWEATIAAAKGDLKTFILENAESLPGVGEACAAAAIANQGSSSVPTCGQVVDKAVDEAIKQIVAERSDAAAHNAGVLVPPGITVEPDPRSMAQPPHFVVKLTRTNLALPPETVCTMYGSMSSVMQNWSWNEYQWKDGNATVVKKGPAEVSGEPFMGVKQVIAPLSPGASMTYELWLTKRIIWFEPDGWNDHYAQQYAEWNGSFNHAWVLLQKGATVTAKLSSNCTTGGQVIQVLTGQAWN